MFSNHFTKLVLAAVLVIVAIAGIIYMAVGQSPSASSVCSPYLSYATTCTPRGFGNSGQCSDGADNDGDHLVDGNDPSCSSPLPGTSHLGESAPISLHSGSGGAGTNSLGGGGTSGGTSTANPASGGASSSGRSAQ